MEKPKKKTRFLEGLATIVMGYLTMRSTDTTPPMGSLDTLQGGLGLFAFAFGCYILVISIMPEIDK